MTHGWARDNQGRGFVIEPGRRFNRRAIGMLAAGICFALLSTAPVRGQLLSTADDDSVRLSATNDPVFALAQDVARNLSPRPREFFDLQFKPHAMAGSNQAKSSPAPAADPVPSATKRLEEIASDLFSMLSPPASHAAPIVDKPSPAKSEPAPLAPPTMSPAELEILDLTAGPKADAVVTDDVEDPADLEPTAAQNKSTEAKTTDAKIQPPSPLAEQTMVLLPAAAPAASPKPPSVSASPARLEVTVRRAEGAAERLRLVRGKSIVLSLSRPISRASVAQPETADVSVVSPTEVVVLGKQFGMTQLVLWTKDGAERVFDLLIEANVPLLEELIQATAPTSRVQARAMQDTIILTGSVPDAATAQRIVELAELMCPNKVRNQMIVAGVQQVLIRCTVAEVNRSALRELNMNWFWGAGKYSRDFFLDNNLNGLNPIPVQNNGVADLLVGRSSFTLLPHQNGLATNLTLGFPRAPFEVFIQALRENGLVRVLAEPNLIAISGQTASFLVGGEVPIPMALQNTFQVEYKKFGVQLEFTPTVVAGQVIRMSIQPEVSDIDPTRQIVVAGFAIPAFTTRRAESTVEVGNGQTIAMAGLLNESVRATARKIPGIGDVPVLGTLFSSVEYSKNQTELVVLVTPELVAPLDPQQVGPVPGQNIRDPNDFELFFNQKLEVPVAPPAQARGGVPRNDRPVNVYPNSTAGSDSAMTMALRGPWGLSAGEDEEAR